MSPHCPCWGWSRCRASQDAHAERRHRPYPVSQFTEEKQVQRRGLIDPKSHKFRSDLDSSPGLQLMLPCDSSVTLSASQVVLLVQTRLPVQEAET